MDCSYAGVRANPFPDEGMMRLNHRLPPAETFAKCRDFAGWLDLTPLQRNYSTSKVGGRALRRLLIIGSNAAVL